MKKNYIACGDSLEILKDLEEESVDVIYLDPPFYTQQVQELSTRDGGNKYSFSDEWPDMEVYLEFMDERLRECHRVLKHTGSIFLHCDRNAAHYLKIVLDRIFGVSNFRSEIIWHYRRWSNSKKGLLNSHQTIFFYSKSSAFKFHTIYTEYSVTTNVDQILQERVRDNDGKTKYKVNEEGETVLGESKKGVPLSDVWEIPYLNPKAKERVGYPTQKPIILLEQIIRLVSDEGDLVLDPFTGSGTAMVAAKRLKRDYIGIDISEDAVKVSEERLKTLVKTDSFLLKKGKKAYQQLDDWQMSILKQIDATPVQRNTGIDGFLQEYVDGFPVSVKIQRSSETLEESVEKLIKSSQKKKCRHMILIRTHMKSEQELSPLHLPEGVAVIDSYDLQIQQILEKPPKRNSFCEAQSG